MDDAQSIGIGGYGFRGGESASLSSISDRADDLSSDEGAMDRGGDGAAPATEVSESDSPPLAAVVSDPGPLGPSSESGGLEPPPPSGSVVSDLTILRTLVDPTRLAIYMAVAWGGARTVREIGLRIGRDPGALYRHFDTLTSAGVLRVVGEVPTSRRAAKVYEAVRFDSFLYRADNPEVIEAINGIVTSASRNAVRSFTRAAGEGRAVTRGPRRDTYMGYQSGWLSEEELAEYNEKVKELREFLLSKERREGTRLIESVIVMAPPAVDEVTGDEGS